MSEWTPTPLGEVTKHVRDVVKMKPGRKYDLLGLRMYGGGVYLRETVDSATSKAAQFYRASAGQFIYNRMFAWGGSFGTVPEHLDGSFVSNEFPLFKCDPDRLLVGFLRLYFQQPRVWEWIDAASTGTTKSRNRWKESLFEAYSIPLPSVSEQSRIVDIIAAVDAQIAAVVEEMKRAERVMTIHRAEYPEADEVALSDVLDGIDSGRSVQTSGEAPDAGDARVLKLSAVRPGLFDGTEAKRLDDLTGYSPSHLVAEGDLLVTRANTPERVGYVVLAQRVPERTYMPDLIWRARVNSSLVSASFLGHLLSAPEFRNRITATAGGTSVSMVKINKRGFGAIRVPVPALVDQHAYVLRCDAAQDALVALSNELARLRMFRCALLSSLLSQDIEIPESYDDLLEAAS